MNESLLRYAYIQYAADTPHDSIIQTLINRGASPSEAQHILDLATIAYCTKSGQTAPQPQPAQEEEGTGIWGAIQLIVGVISLIASVAQCVN